jgi:hypothetical protein
LEMVLAILTNYDTGTHLTLRFERTANPSVDLWFLEIISNWPQILQEHETAY